MENSKGPGIDGLVFQLSAYADDIIVAIRGESDVLTLTGMIECFIRIT